MLFTLPHCRVSMKGHRWTYFSGNQRHIAQSFELLNALCECAACVTGPTHTNTHSKEPVFLHMGPRWEEKTGWQKLEWESVVLQLTSPSAKVLRAAAELRWKVYSGGRNLRPVTQQLGSFISCFSRQRQQQRPLCFFSCRLTSESSPSSLSPSKLVIDDVPAQIGTLQH